MIRIRVYSSDPETWTNYWKRIFSSKMSPLPLPRTKVLSQRIVWLYILQSGVACRVIVSELFYEHAIHPDSGLNPFKYKVIHSSENGIRWLKTMSHPAAVYNDYICLRMNNSKCIFTLNIFLICDRLHFNDLYYTKNHKKRFNVSKENVFKVIQILLEPIGLKKNITLPLLFNPF